MEWYPKSANCMNKGVSKASMCRTLCGEQQDLKENVEGLDPGTPGSLDLQVLCTKHFPVHELWGPLRHAKVEEDKYTYPVYR